MEAIYSESELLVKYRMLTATSKKAVNELVDHLIAAEVEGPVSDLTAQEQLEYSIELERQSDA